MGKNPKYFWSSLFQVKFVQNSNVKLGTFMEYKVKHSLLTLIQKKPMKLRNRHLTTGEKEQHMFSAWPQKNSI